MELSEEQLNKIYERKSQLGAFLEDCALSIFSHKWRILDPKVTDLPERELIELFEWWKKKSAKQKYTIKVAPTSLGYFGIDYDEGDATIDSSKNEFYQTYFTKSEIEQLKQRDDLAIDWDKAIIEPAGCD